MKYHLTVVWSGRAVSIKSEIIDHQEASQAEFVHREWFVERSALNLQISICLQIGWGGELRSLGGGSLQKILKKIDSGSL